MVQCQGNSEHCKPSYEYKGIPVSYTHLTTNKSGLGGMKMPLRYVCEMVCDRVAASQIYLGDKYTDCLLYTSGH